jgi:hypothetical protein
MNRYEKFKEVFGVNHDDIKFNNNWWLEDYSKDKSIAEYIDELKVLYEEYKVLKIIELNKSYINDNGQIIKNDILVENKIKDISNKMDIIKQKIEWFIH